MSPVHHHPADRVIRRQGRPGEQEPSLVGLVRLVPSAPVRQDPA